MSMFIATTQTPRISFPIQHQWIAYFGGWGIARFRRVCGWMAAENATGIVLHLQPGTSLPIPSVLAQWMDIATDNGLRVYFSIGPDIVLDSHDRSFIANQLDRAQNRWAGAIMDPEQIWQDWATHNRPEAYARIDATAAMLRERVPLIAYAPFASPGARKGFRYEKFNEKFDLCIPQCYDFTIDQMARSFHVATRAPYWYGDLKPIVPMKAAWGLGPGVSGYARDFATQAVHDYGGCGWWRADYVTELLIPKRNWQTGVSDVMKSQPRGFIDGTVIDPPPPPPPPPPPDDGNPYDEPWYYNGVYNSPKIATTAGSGAAVAGGIILLAIGGAFLVYHYGASKLKMPVLDALQGDD